MIPSRRQSLQVAVLILLFAGLGLAHFLVSPHNHQVHDFLFKGTYLQIILAALWFGLRGGLLMSGITSILYLFHILLQLRGHGPHSTEALITELFLYNVIAVVTGVLSGRQLRARRALEATSRDLDLSYRTLQEKTRELLQVEEQLRQSERLRTMGELAAGMAHEVRNPLGGIQGAAEILARPGTSVEARAEFAQVLSREIRRLDRVIGDFLDYSRPRSPKTAEVAVTGVLDSVLRLVEATLRKQRIVVQRVWESHAPEDLVRADGEHLKQVFLNLILNAIQAMPAGGTLALDCRRAEGEARVTVADTGGGIPEEIRDRFLEPFVTGRPSGTGLGLSIAARILQGIGGRLTLLRTGPEGTTFEVAIPAAGELSTASDSR